MTKPKSQGPDLTPTLLEIQAQLAQLKAELDSLKNHTNSPSQAHSQPASEPKPKVSTTRRRLLRQLAGGLVAGLAVAGIGSATPEGAEAKITSNPTGNGLTGRVGMLVMPPGGTVGNTTMGGSPNKVGLLVSGDNSFSLTDIAPTVNSAIIAKTAGGGSTIVGLALDGVAIYGNSSTNNAVWGISTSGNGVRGESTSGNGVYGSTANTSSTAAAGVLGTSTGNSDSGVKGTNDNYGTGVRGESDNGYGVWGTSNGTGVRGESDNGYGVYGGTTNGYGIFGNSATTGYAGYFGGKVQITGNLSKGGGSFKIDHPLDPANKYLYHSFVESPDMMNIYNGIASLDDQGEATVTMPDWFEALNFDFRYQLTCLGEFAPVFIAEKLTNRRFKIAGGKAGQEVSWMVTGIRQDEWAKAHRIQVEVDKTGDEKGKYLNPELFGQGEEKSVSPRPPQRPQGPEGK